jgi:hypothetical protein
MRGIFVHLEGVPPQIQVGERHLPGLVDRYHDLRRCDLSTMTEETVSQEDWVWILSQSQREHPMRQTGQ